MSSRGARDRFEGPRADALGPYLLDDTLCGPTMDAVRHWQPSAMRMDPKKVIGYLCAVARTHEQQAVLLRSGNVPVQQALAASPFLTGDAYNRLATHKDQVVRRRALWRCTDPTLLRDAAMSRNERIREAALSNPLMPVEQLAESVSSGSFASAINPTTPEPARRSALTPDLLYRHALTGRHLPYNASERRSARCWALVSYNPWLHEEMTRFKGTLRDAMVTWTEIVERGYLELTDDQLVDLTAKAELPRYVIGVVAQRNPAHSGLRALVLGGGADDDENQMGFDPYTLGRLNLTYGPRVALPWGDAKANDNPTAPFTPSADVFLPGSSEDWREIETWSDQRHVELAVIETLIALAPGWSGDIHSLLDASARL